jgi:hypothetical protein
MEKGARQDESNGSKRAIVSRWRLIGVHDAGAQPKRGLALEPNSPTL